MKEGRTGAKKKYNCREGKKFKNEGKCDKRYEKRDGTAEETPGKTVL